jgi:hypothetical protein
MADSPNFITYGGDITVMPPFQLDRPSMYCFFFESQCDKLRSILDNRLNFPNNGKRYVPFTDSVMVIFADTPHAYSGSDQNQGFITMAEAVFWILAVEQEQDHRGGWKSKRLVWFIPYIFVNNPVELIAGREVAGYPKAWADVIMPKSMHYANTFAINPSSYASFGINNEFINNRLMTIQNTSAQTNFGEELKDMAHMKSSIQSFFEKFKEGNRFGICDGAVDGLGDVIRLSESLFADLKSLEMPAVFLKQFRSASDDGKACYQAIVESAFKVNGFHGGWFLNASDYQLDINHLDSFPVDTDLGFYTGQKPTHAIWLNLSFENTSGKEIWVAS